MKKQRIMSLLLSLAMVFSLLPAGASAVNVKTFEDVSKDAWYYDYVKYVADKEYFVGTSKTTFSPEMPMTRAMFVTVLAAVEKVKVNNNVSPFADVPANTWYSGAVAWAAEKGVVAGVGDNKFAPDASITREQMAVMMNAYIKWTGNDHKEKSKVESFKDADKISSWAKDAVEACRNWGLVAGMPDGNFWPANTASRAEVATVIKNLAFMVYGGGGGGGGDYYTDYIYEALNDSLADVKAELKDQGKLLLDASNLDEITLKFLKDNGLLGEDYLVIEDGVVRFGGDNTFASVSGITLGDANAVGTKGQDHAINVDALVKVETTSIVNLFNAVYEAAVEYAGKLVGSASVTTMTKDDAKEIAKEIAKDFEEATGITLSVDTIENAAAKLQAAPEAMTAYARGLVEYFKDDEGNYYTSDVTFTVNGKVAVTVDVAADGKSAALVGTKADAIKALAVGIAKDLYADLKKVTEFKALTDIALDFMVDVDFSAPVNETYKASTEQFPYSYPVTFTLDIEGTALDNVEYKYHNGHDHINLVITKQMQDAYGELASALVDKVVTPMINDKIADAMGNLGGSTSTVSTFAVSRATPALPDMSSFVDTWINEVLTGDLANSTLLDYLSGNKDAELNNEALYDAIDNTLADAIPQAIEAAGIIPGGIAAVQAAKNPDEMKDILKDYSPDAYEALESKGLLNYTIASLQGALDPEGENLAEGESYITPTVRNEMEESIDKVVTDALDDVADNPDYSQYLALADKAAELATFEGLSKAKLGGLADALRSNTFKSVVSNIDDSVVARVTDLIKYIPAEASVVFAGETIDQSVLADIRAAKTSAAACEAVADFIDLFEDLSMKSFGGEGQSVKVKYNSNVVEFFVSIEIKA